MYFKYHELLAPPILRAAYSDRTAWLMAEMSRLAYIKFEEKDSELRTALSNANFELIQIFNSEGTQAFLAKRDSDKMIVLSFRGTEKDDPRDVITDLDVTFYTGENGVKIHNGFCKAYELVKDAITMAVAEFKGYALYVTGHSLGGALALIATRSFNSDNLAACYTFGSPKVGNEEFDDDIKPPIYRVVNAYDLVPFSPPTYIFEIMHSLPWKKLRSFTGKFLGYAHHGDMRYLTPCTDSFDNLKIVSNYNEFLRLIEVRTHKKESLQHHAINGYCEKLAQVALKRLNVK